MDAYMEHIQREGWSEEFQAKMLQRMISDCDYYCGYGQMGGKKLWAGNIDDQIGFMLAIVQMIGEQIISKSEIMDYKHKMVDIDMRVKMAKECRLSEKMNHMPVGVYAYIPVWAKDHPEVHTGYSIVVPYAKSKEKTADQGSGIIMIPYFEDDADVAYYSIEEIEARVSQNLAALNMVHMLSYPYPERLKERVKQAIKNDHVFLDLDNDEMWYVRLPADEMDPMCPIQMKDGYYTHIFGQFRFYPLSTLHLKRKEQFHRHVDLVMDEIFEKVCEEINAMSIEEEQSIETQSYFFKDPFFFWTILNRHKAVIESFVEIPTEETLLTIFDETAITKHAQLMGHEGEMQLTIKTHGGSHIVGRFLYRSTHRGVDSITCIPFTVRRSHEDDLIKLYFSSPITRQILACGTEGHKVLMSFLKQQQWLVNGDMAQTIFRKATAPIWIEKEIREISNITLTIKKFPTETGVEEFFCAVCKRYQMEKILINS